MARVVLIMNALLDALNEATGFSQTFTAQRAYRPVIRLSEQDGLRVTVVPRSRALSRASRDRDQEDWEIDVAVQKRLSPVAETESAELDDLAKFVDELVGLLRGQRLDIGDDVAVAWVETVNQPVYAPEHLEELRQFTSVLTVTYRVFT